MTVPDHIPSPSHVIKRGAPVLGLAFLAVAGMLAAYWFVPVPNKEDSPILVFLGIIVMGIIYLVAGVGAIFMISRSKNPLRTGIILLAVMLTAVVVIFALTYVSLSASDPGNFNVPLDKVSSLYFTMAILSTVGFGDIHAQSHAAMIAVMLQMVLGLTLITVMARVLVASTKAATKRRAQQQQ